jgi:glycosyltransferase involved in cell wall biosynthesis
VKLIFLTQVLDRGDAVLGFVPRWVEGLARACERVRVIALGVGDARSLPANVDWREVGRRGYFGRYLRYRSFLREAFARDGFDAALAHMVPRYALLASPVARRHGARVYLWYAHGTVDARLRRAVERVEKVFSASEESLRVDTGKRVITGHGIDIAHFDARGETPAQPPRVLAVGRVTPSKDPLTAIAAAAILVSRGLDLSLDLVGDALAPGDESYRRSVEDAIESGGLRGRVRWHGNVPYRDVPPYFRRASVLVNASSTGGADKVVLEAMACERMVLTCNDAFPRLFRELGEDARRLVFRRGDASELADKLAALLDMGETARRDLARRLRSIIARDHEVDATMRRLAREMEPRP